MITGIRFCGRKHIAQVRADLTHAHKQYVVFSLPDPTEGFPKQAWTSLEWRLPSAASCYPCNDTTWVTDSRVFTPAMARDIALRVRDLHNPEFNPLGYVIVAQCEAGISRSAAVAEALRRFTGLEPQQYAEFPAYPNPLILRLLLTELGLDPAEREGA